MMTTGERHFASKRHATAARSGWPVRLGSVALGALLVVAIIAMLLGLSWPYVLIMLVGIAVTTAGWAVSRLRAERASHAAAEAQWAAKEAVLAERLRIARDLHDLVSHGLGLITVRVAAARHVHAQQADAAALAEAMSDIEALSRQATLELRRMLETLRDAGEPAPRHPADSLTSLPDLIAGAQRAGMEVELQQGDLGPVTPGVQQAICAIVREGLSNSARHAGRTRVQIRLARAHDTISVTITDDGPVPDWTAAPGAGHGLTGLRERVSGLGGTLHAAPHGTGFRLTATIPDEGRP
jgi:signal transduction histidine kinase